MVLFAALDELPAPPLPPAPNNLVSVAQKGRDAVRWERGGSFPDFACLEGHAQSPKCPPSQLSTAQTCTMPVGFSPVLIELSVSWDVLNYEDACKELPLTLERATSSLLEKELELGALAGAAGFTNPHLSSGTDISAAAPAGAQSVGAIQDWIMDPANTSGGLATLFMSYTTAISVDLALDDDDTGAVFTKYGQWPVVVGNFTPGWVYAVPGLIDLYLGDIEVIEHHERTTNEMIVTAQRLAMVTYHSCAAVRTQTS